MKTIFVAFKLLPLGSYAPMPAPSPPYKTIFELVLWNGLQSSRGIPVRISFIFGDRKTSLRARSGE
jgi:hypothetical protein